MSTGCKRIPENEMSASELAVAQASLSYTLCIVLINNSTTVRLKAEQIQLVIARCAFGYVGLARERSLYLHLFECCDGNDLQQCVEGRFQPEPFASDSNQHVDRDGDPDLRLHRVLRGAVEPLDPQMLLDPFEEEFHLPTTFVEIADGRGRQRRLVG